MLLTRRGFLAALVGGAVLAAGAPAEAIPATPTAAPAMLSRTWALPTSHHHYWYSLRHKIRSLKRTPGHSQKKDPPKMGGSKYYLTIDLLV